MLNFKKAITELDELFLKEKEGKIYKFLVENLEKPLLEKILEKTGGNQLKAARILGINRNTLHAKIKKLGIYVQKWKGSL